MNLSNNTLLQGGKYKIVRFISAGGFGCTYEGVHTMLDTHFAIDQYSGTYLTSMILEDDSSGNYAWALYFDNKKHSLKGVKRYFGSVIRPVYIQ